MKKKENRFKLQYSLSKLIYRIIWEYFGIILFKLTPNRLFVVKNIILRIYGAKIGDNVRVYSSVHIHFPKNLSIGHHTVIGSKVEIKNHNNIKIGNYCTISQKSSIVDSSHDFNNKDFPLVSKSIEIKDNVWIAQECFLGPGVKIQSNVVLGSRAVCFKSLEEGVYVGNPLKKIK